MSEPALYLREGVSGAPGGRTFSWPRSSLWNIARRRYFTVAVVPVAEGRDHDDRCVWTILREVAAQIMAAHVLQVHIRDHHVEVGDAVGELLTQAVVKHV